MIDGFDTSGGHLLYLLPAVIAVARSVWFPTERQLDRWLVGYGLSPEGDGRTLARAYLRRTRAIRSAGFVLGYTVLPLAWLWYTRSAYRMNEWPGLWVLVGCFAGGVMLAELLRPRLPSGALAASEPRTIAAYVPAFTRTDPVWMAAGFAVLALWSLLAAPAATTGSILVNAGGATFAFVVARSLQRWILSRPQRAASVELLRVDDAIRATGATGLSALAYGAPLYLLSIVLWDTVNEGVVAGTMRTLFSVAAVALGLTATTISVGFLSLASTWPVPRLRIALGSPRTGGAAT